jgi:nucleoside-diphosphate-sugar epimerase
MMLNVVSSSDLEHVGNHARIQWTNLKHKKLFITGGTGFIGKWLLETLVHVNRTMGLMCEATVLTRDPELFRRNCPHLANAPGISLLLGDVRKFDFPDTHIDMVIHGAVDIAVSGSPLHVLDTCIGGTQHVLKFAAYSGAKDFLLLSSGAIYGSQPSNLPALAESWCGAPNPLAPGAAYGTGKRAAECLAIQAGLQQDMRIKIARCFAFVGPYLPMDKHFAIGNFILDALGGKNITIQGDGTPLRSYLYAADLAAWLWTILLSGENGVAYNVGGEEVLSIAELAHIVKAALNSEVSVVCKTAPINNSAPTRYVPDLGKARRELGLQPLVSLQDAIQRTAKWVNMKEPV